MILYILAIVVFIAATFIHKKVQWKCETHWEILDGVSCIAMFITSIFLVLGTGVFIITHWNVDGKLENVNSIRENLVYQLEEGYYINDNNVYSKELFDDVRDFNSSVRAGQRGLENPWISMFYFPKWNEVEVINFDDYR
jgi:hypothetical protein